MGKSTSVALCCLYTLIPIPNPAIWRYLLFLVCVTENEHCYIKVQLHNAQMYQASDTAQQNRLVQATSLFFFYPQIWEEEWKNIFSADPEQQTEQSRVQSARIRSTSNEPLRQTCRSQHFWFPASFALEEAEPHAFITSVLRCARHQTETSCGCPCLISYTGFHKHFDRFRVATLGKNNPRKSVFINPN